MVACGVGVSIAGQHAFFFSSLYKTPIRDFMALKSHTGWSCSILRLDGDQRIHFQGGSVSGQCWCRVDWARAFILITWASPQSCFASSRESDPREHGSCNAFVTHLQKAYPVTSTRITSQDSNGGDYGREGISKRKDHWDHFGGPCIQVYSINSTCPFLPREIETFPLIAGSMFFPLQLGQNSVNTSTSRSCEWCYVTSKTKL